MENGDKVYRLTDHVYLEDGEVARVVRMKRRPCVGCGYAYFDGDVLDVHRDVYGGPQTLWSRNDLAVAWQAEMGPFATRDRIGRPGADGKIGTPDDLPATVTNALAAGQRLFEETDQLLVALGRGGVFERPSVGQRLGGPSYRLPGGRTIDSFGGGNPFGPAISGDRLGAFGYQSIQVIGAFHPGPEFQLFTQSTGEDGSLTKKQAEEAKKNTGVLTKVWDYLFGKSNDALAGETGTSDSKPDKPPPSKPLPEYDEDEKYCAADEPCGPQTTILLAPGTRPRGIGWWTQPTNPDGPGSGGPELDPGGIPRVTDRDLVSLRDPDYQQALPLSPGQMAKTIELYNSIHGPRTVHGPEGPLTGGSQEDPRGDR